MTPEAYGPWNPGIESTLPRRLLPLATLYRPDNVFGTLEDALELGRAARARLESALRAISWGYGR